jgi:hypothetical protein
MRKRCCRPGLFLLVLPLVGCLTAPIAGGWVKIPRHDAAALEAYVFLGQELSGSHPEIVLGELNRAARQVGAG